jgi:NAD(P)-dependent dehydrogenase (short-subunit alcohol dehydrogenase family)
VSGAQEVRAGPARAPVVLITGATDGLGREVALRMGATGAHVIVHGRNRERGEAVVAEIARGGKGSAKFHAADFGSLVQVRAFADTILREYDRIDVLVNNAGIWVPSGQREVSADGFERHFAVNYLAHYLLTRLILPRVLAAAPSRIVNIASVAQNPFNFDDVMLTSAYSGSRAYGQSKLALIMFTIDLAQELEGKGVTVVALHPATLMNTTMVTGAGIQPRSTLEEGANALMHAINGSDVKSGEYFNGLRATRAHEQAYDASARERLRTLSDDLIRGRPR